MSDCRCGDKEWWKHIVPEELVPAPERVPNLVTIPFEVPKLLATILQELSRRQKITVNQLLKLWVDERLGTERDRLRIQREIKDLEVEIDRLKETGENPRLLA